MKTPSIIALGIALIIGGLVICGFGLSLLSRPQQYEATLRLQYLRDDADSSRFPELMVHDPSIVCDTIQSPLILSNVAVTLDLRDTWVRKHANDKNPTMDEVVHWLKARTRAEPIRYTNLIKIGFTDDDPRNAIKTVMAIAEAYQDYRLNLPKQAEEKSIKTLQDQYHEQEQQIQILHSNVENLRRTLNITETDPSSYIPAMSREESTLMKQQMTELEKDYRQISAQYNELTKLDKQKRRVAVLAIISDTTLSQLLAQLHAAEEKLANDMQSSYYNISNRLDTTTLELRSQIDELNRQIDERLDGIMLGFKAQVASKKAGIDSLKSDLKEAEERGQARGTKNQSYFDAMEKEGQLTEQHKLLALKLDALKVNLSIQELPVVQIVDPAVSRMVPIGGNFFLGMVLFTIGLVPILGGWLLIKASRIHGGHG